MTGYKPLDSPDIGAASVMILPPVVPKESDILAWVSLTAYSIGNIIQTSAGDLYWVVIAGTSGTEPTHTDGDASAIGSVTYRAMRGVRDQVTLTNMQAVMVSVAKGNAAVASKGIVLTTLGSTHNEGYNDGPRPYQGAWYAIAASGAANKLAIQEA